MGENNDNTEPTNEFLQQCSQNIHLKKSVCYKTNFKLLPKHRKSAENFV